MTAHRQGADCEAQWVITNQESPETEVLTADGTRRQGLNPRYAVQSSFVFSTVV
jgi:hypothetical protein